MEGQELWRTKRTQPCAGQGFHACSMQAPLLALGSWRVLGRWRDWAAFAMQRVGWQWCAELPVLSPAARVVFRSCVCIRTSVSDLHPSLLGNNGTEN